MIKGRQPPFASTFMPPIFHAYKWQHCYCIARLLNVETNVKLFDVLYRILFTSVIVIFLRRMENYFNQLMPILLCKIKAYIRKYKFNLKHITRSTQCKHEEYGRYSK